MRVLPSCRTISGFRHVKMQKSSNSTISVYGKNYHKLPFSVISLHLFVGQKGSNVLGIVIYDV